MILNSPYISGSLTVTGNATIQGSISGTITGSATSASYAQTASSIANLNQNVQITGSLTTNGTITAQTLVVQTVTSSVVYSSGSNIFGNSQSNVQQMTGSLRVTGSSIISGQIKTSFAGQSISVDGGSIASVRMQLQNTSGNAGVTVESSTGGDQFTGTSAYSMAIGTYTEKNFHIGTNSVTRLTVSSSGQVGIGTSSPTEILETNGSIRALQTTNDGICQLIADSSNSTTYRAALATFGNTAAGTLLGITRASNSFLYKNGAALIIGTGASDPLIFSTNSTERMRIASGGNLQVTGSATFSSTVATTGVVFPATQVASADANTLDDYEEGTFTPNVGGNATYSTQLGEYTKIGNMVYVRGQLVISAIGNGSTTNFGGLPFNSSLENGFCINKLTNSSLSFYSIYLRTSGTLVYASYQSALDGTLVVNPAYLTDSTEIQFSGCYRTS